MGILYDMPSFYRWLEDASDRELLVKRDDLKHKIDHILTEERVISEARRLLGKIEEELLARTLK
ncbi:MAG: hypothetical protein JXR29_05780 [Methylothermaceae bacterium]|nr:hypothetical protein [Methylothermaceae bacterium]